MDGPGHSGREAVGVMCPAACVCVLVVQREGSWIAPPTHRHTLQDT